CHNRWYSQYYFKPNVDTLCHGMVKMKFEMNKNMAILFAIILVISSTATFLTVQFLKGAEIESLNESIAELQNEVETKETEITLLTLKGENFTYHLLRSMSLLDISSEIRGNGNLHFDYAARIWYPQHDYQRVIDNCSQAMTYYQDAREKFDLAQDYFSETKEYTSISTYLQILDLYVELAKSGHSLSRLRYNASRELRDIAQDLLNESFLENASELLDLFNMTLLTFDTQYQQGFSDYQDIIDEIEEEHGGFFNPKREIP
ncbi:MAG: hypothetical protein QCI00_00330, partial [Candidatus Thermoplasmatota archaeon]|nr:hypothetical protein [Candidatus Thermoplasmatota archaeon]